MPKAVESMKEEVQKVVEGDRDEIYKAMELNAAVLGTVHCCQYCYDLFIV